MGAINRWHAARGRCGGRVDRGAWTDARLDAVWDQFDQGTQRAILRLAAPRRRTWRWRSAGARSSAGDS